MTAREVQPPTFLAVLHLLRCPVDSSSLTWEAQAQRLTCARGVHGYPVVDGIPCLFTSNEWPAGISDVTDIVKAFYEETPFPNYEGLDTRDSLRRKATEGVFGWVLDKQLPPGALI